MNIGKKLIYNYYKVWRNWVAFLKNKILFCNDIVAATVISYFINKKDKMSNHVILNLVFGEFLESIMKSSIEISRFFFFE